MFGHSYGHDSMCAGKPSSTHLNTLDIITSPIENFLEPPEVEKCPKNGPKLRNFESLSWLWKTTFGLWRVFWSLASLLQVVMSRFDVGWIALVYGNLLNTLNVIISPVKNFLEPPEVEKCLKNCFFRANWDFRNFWVLVSFWGIFQLFMGYMMTFKVFKRLT